MPHTTATPIARIALTTHRHDTPSATQRVILACQALPEWYVAHAHVIARHSRPLCHIKPRRAADRLQERHTTCLTALPPIVGLPELLTDVQRLLTDLLGYLQSGLAPQTMARQLRTERDFVPIHPDHVCTLSIAQRALTLACVGVELHRGLLDHAVDTGALLDRIDALLERTHTLRDDPATRHWLRRDRDAAAETAVLLLSEAHRVAIKACVEDPGLLTHLRAMWRVHAPRRAAVRLPRRRALVVAGRVAPGKALRCA